jgi:uncharacterized protein YbcV (DUF1398 family)
MAGMFSVSLLLQFMSKHIRGQRKFKRTKRKMSESGVYQWRILVKKSGRAEMQHYEISPIIAPQCQGILTIIM